MAAFTTARGKGGVVRLWVLSLVLVLGSHAARADFVPAQQAFDWQILVVTAGSHGAGNIQITQSVYGQSVDDHLGVLVAVGEPSEHASYGFSADIPFSSAPPSEVRTTMTLGGIDLSLTGARSPGTAFVSSGVGSLVPTMRPGQTVASLFAGTNARFDHVQNVVHAASGTIAKVRVYRGVGTSFLPIVTAGSGGDGAEIGPLFTGDATLSARFTTAVVGATTQGQEGVEHGSWTAPAGPAHPFAQRYSGGGAAASCADLGNWFSGPAGQWQFDLNGVMQYRGRPVRAVLAPLGPLTTYFPPTPPFTTGSPCDA